MGDKKEGKYSGIRKAVSSQLIPLSVLALLVIISSIASPVFLTSANFENILLQMAVTMIISCGMFTILLTGGIDLSVGSIAAVSGVMVSTWLESTNWLLAGVIAIFVGLLLGTLNGLLVSKLKVAPFITTLGTMYFARGLAYWFTHAKTILWTSFENVDSFKYMGGGRIFGFLPIPALIWIIVFVITIILIKYS